MVKTQASPGQYSNRAIKHVESIHTGYKKYTFTTNKLKTFLPVIQLVLSGECTSGASGPLFDQAGNLSPNTEGAAELHRSLQRSLQIHAAVSCILSSQS